jgi:hypothetical protein
VVAARPDRFRLEAFSLGGLASLAVCDGERLAVYVPQDGAVYRGAATPLNMARFVGVALSPGEVVDVLLGGAPGRAGQAAAAWGTEAKRGVDRGRGLLSVEVGSPRGGRQVLSFDGRTGRLVRSEELGSDGRAFLWAEFAEYERVGSVWFPRRILLGDEVEERRLTLRYERLELNPTLSADLFVAPSGPGLRELDMDSPAGEGENTPTPRP